MRHAAQPQIDEYKCCSQGSKRRIDIWGFVKSAIENTLHALGRTA
jgi:hypothetical protein